jgi:hypothetical protein
LGFSLQHQGVEEMAEAQRSKDVVRFIERGVSDDERTVEVTQRAYV